MNIVVSILRVLLYFCVGGSVLKAITEVAVRHWLLSFEWVLAALFFWICALLIKESSDKSENEDDHKS